VKKQWRGDGCPVFSEDGWFGWPVVEAPAAVGRRWVLRWEEAVNGTPAAAAGGRSVGTAEGACWR